MGAAQHVSVGGLQPAVRSTHSVSVADRVRFCDHRHHEPGSSISERPSMVSTIDSSQLNVCWFVRDHCKTTGDVSRPGRNTCAGSVGSLLTFFFEGSLASLRMVPLAVGRSLNCSASCSATRRATSPAKAEGAIAQRPSQREKDVAGGPAENSPSVLGCSFIPLLMRETSETDKFAFSLFLVIPGLRKSLPVSSLVLSW